ncbi:hypothetical protein KCU93_g2674, partial [Aureobasidium melanogenum]
MNAQKEAELLAMQHILGLKDASDETVNIKPKQLERLQRLKAAEPVFVCVDLEAFEFAQDKITEVGLSILDSRHVIGADPGPDGKEWLSKINTRHILIKEHKHLVNKRFISGCPDKFNFGDSEVVPLRHIHKTLTQMFDNPSPASIRASDRGSRNLIFVGHGLSNDTLYLNKLKFDPNAKGNIIHKVDTQKFVGTKKQQVGLSKLLAGLGIEPENLHNAGNDAAYTMQALLLITVQHTNNPGAYVKAVADAKAKVDPAKQRYKNHKATIRANKLAQEEEVATDVALPQTPKLGHHDVESALPAISYNSSLVASKSFNQASSIGTQGQARSSAVSELNRSILDGKTSSDEFTAYKKSARSSPAGKEGTEPCYTRTSLSSHNGRPAYLRSSTTDHAALDSPSRKRKSSDVEPIGDENKAWLSVNKHLTEDSDESPEDALDAKLATEIDASIAKLVANEESRAATAKFYELSIEELNLMLEAAQEVANDIPVPTPNSKWRPPAPDILQQPLQGTSISQRSDGLNIYIDALKKDKTTIHLVRSLVEKYKSGTKQEIDNFALTASFAEILFLTHTPVLVGVLEGNLAQKYFSDIKTRCVLDFLAHESAASRVQPGIYCNSIGHVDTGEFLTLEEARQVIEMMKKYNNNTDLELVQRLNNVHNNKSGRPKQGYSRTDRAQRQTRSFLSAFGARIKNIASKDHDPSRPIPVSIHEFGYGLDVENRLQCHRRHYKSNYIMNLFESCCKLLFANKFKLHQFVVFLLRRPYQACTAEVLFHLIGQGFITDGAGFSHWPAGLNSAPAFDLDGQHWVRMTSWCEQSTPFKRNVKDFENALKEQRESSKERSDDARRLQDDLKRERDQFSPSSPNLAAHVSAFEEYFDELSIEVALGEAKSP